MNDAYIYMSVCVCYFLQRGMRIRKIISLKFEVEILFFHLQEIKGSYKNQLLNSVVPQPEDSS